MQSPVDQMNHTSQDFILVIKTQMDRFLISGKIQVWTNRFDKGTYNTSSSNKYLNSKQKN